MLSEPTAQHTTLPVLVEKLAINSTQAINPQDIALLLFYAEVMVVILEQVLIAHKGDALAVQVTLDFYTKIVACLKRLQASNLTEKAE